MAQIKTVDVSWTGREVGGTHSTNPMVSRIYIHMHFNHTEYVTHTYRHAVVVFYGYDNTNTNDMTHQSRPKCNAGTTVTFTGDTPVTMNKDQFLANRQNMQRFIFMLSEKLTNNDCEAHHASGDADLLIVQKLEQSATSRNTVLVGDDTYLLVLLCYNACLESSHDLLFCHEPKKNTKQPRTWNINAVKQRLGPDMCQHILFLHAALGCDTTYRIHGNGNGHSLNKYQTNKAFREHAKVLHIHSASTYDVIPPSHRRRGTTAVLVRHKPQWHRHCRRGSAVTPP